MVKNVTLSHFERRKISLLFFTIIIIKKIKEPLSADFRFEKDKSTVFKSIILIPLHINFETLDIPLVVASLLARLIENIIETYSKILIGDKKLLIQRLALKFEI
jgi:hypothetical protein